MKTTMSENPLLRIVVLCILDCAQGIPHGFVTFALYIRTYHNVLLDDLSRVEDVEFLRMTQDRGLEVMDTMPGWREVAHQLRDPRGPVVVWPGEDESFGQLVLQLCRCISMAKL